MAAGRSTVQPDGTVPLQKESEMSVPPRSTRGWEVEGEQSPPAHRSPKSDRLGIGLVAIVLVALVVAIALLLL
jgi:hypothetical protein